MTARKEYVDQLKLLRGKTVAIVYIFENEEAAGFDHYWVWKSDIISYWLNAVHEIGCLPFVLDVRTFVQKAIYRDLPKIDYVLNLNCGSCNLSSMALIPSMCSFMGIPCVPCDAASIVMSENKKIANILARFHNINVPKDLDHSDKNGIYRPLNLGSSIGIHRGPPSDCSQAGVYQEFVPGFDVAIPIVFNPLKKDLDLLPSIVYLPKNHDSNWIYDEAEKMNDNGFNVYPVVNISETLYKDIIEYAKLFPIQTFARIDARLKIPADTSPQEIMDYMIESKDLFFVEINSMPTIEPEDSFEFAVNAAKKTRNSSFYEVVNTYYNYTKNPTINGFLLANSMLSFIAKY